MTTELRAALDDFKPAIATQYADSIRSLYNSMVKDLGPGLKNVGNDWTWARIFNGLVRQYLTGDRTQLKEDALEAGAVKYAEAAVEAWAGKIEAKMGELDSATVHRMDGIAFTISGIKHGKEVAIHQEMIVNVSKLGKPFNQFPATITFDGKAISAAAYKKLSA